jgi:hypothetical protein
MEVHPLKEEKHPKVFISHAGEDKERFVLDFAERLRQKGVDAWLDKWEMKPGDSLIDKIFEEGIRECDIFIVVLSKNSITKRWVREELNAGIVQRIEKSTKIIPVIIDEGIEIPTSLKDTVWTRIEDLSEYDKEFAQILMSIYNETEKPPLGEKPKFTIDISIPGLNKIDSVVLRALGDMVHKKDEAARVIMCWEIIQRTCESEIPEEKTYESLEVLESNGLIEIQRYIGAREMYLVKLSSSGFMKYLENFVDGSNQILKDVISSIINEGLRTDREIASKTGHKLVEVVGILEYFDVCGFIRLLRPIGGPNMISQISAVGKRSFENILRG